MNASRTCCIAASIATFLKSWKYFRRVTLNFLSEMAALTRETVLQRRTAAAGPRSSVCWDSRWFYRTPGLPRRRRLIFRIPRTRGAVYSLPCALPWPSPNFGRGRQPGTDGWPPQRDPKLVSPQVSEPRQRDMFSCASGRHPLAAYRCTPNSDAGFTDCGPRPAR